MAVVAKKWISTLLLLSGIVVFLHATWSIWRIVSTHAPDFSVYFDSAVRLSRGMDVYTNTGSFTHFVGPITTLLFFLPLTVFPYAVAQTIWVCLSFAAFLGSIWGTGKLLNIRKWQWYVGAGVLGYMAFPTKFTLGMGQINLASLAFLITGLVCVRRNRRWVGWLAIAIALLLKPQLMVLLAPIMVGVGVWSGIGILVCMALVGIISMIFFGIYPWVQFVRHASPIAASFSGRDIYYNQSVSGTVARLFSPDVAPAVSLAISAALFIALLWYVYRFRRGMIEVIVYALPVVLSIDPLSWQHHYVFLIPSFAYAWNRISSRNDAILWGISYVAVAANIAHPELLRFGLLNGVIASHVFWGNILLMFLLVKNGSTIQKAKI